MNATQSENTPSVVVVGIGAGALRSHRCLKHVTQKLERLKVELGSEGQIMVIFDDHLFLDTPSVPNPLKSFMPAVRGTKPFAMIQLIQQEMLAGRDWKELFRNEYDFWMNLVEQYGHDTPTNQVFKTILQSLENGVSSDEFYSLVPKFVWKEMSSAIGSWEGIFHLDELRNGTVSSAWPGFKPSAFAAEGMSLDVAVLTLANMVQAVRVLVIDDRMVYRAETPDQEHPFQTSDSIGSISTNHVRLLMEAGTPVTSEKTLTLIDRGQPLELHGFDVSDAEVGEQIAIIIPKSAELQDTRFVAIRGSHGLCLTMPVKNLLEAVFTFGDMGRVLQEINVETVHISFSPQSIKAFVRLGTLFDETVDGKKINQIPNVVTQKVGMVSVIGTAFDRGTWRFHEALGLAARPEMRDDSDEETYNLAGDKLNPSQVVPVSVEHLMIVTPSEELNRTIEFLDNQLATQGVIYARSLERAMPVVAKPVQSVMISPMTPPAPGVVEPPTRLSFDQSEKAAEPMAPFNPPQADPDATVSFRKPVVAPPPPPAAAFATGPKTEATDVDPKSPSSAA